MEVQNLTDQAAPGEEGVSDCIVRPQSTITAPSGRAALDLRWVTKGHFCVIPEHGLVLIESSKGPDGCYTVKVSETMSLQVSNEVMRAPREATFAWPAGTRVGYLSSRLGKWIDACVISFNPSSGGTYNL